MTPAIDLRPDHRKIVEDILCDNLPGGVKVWVFGSRAEWTTKESSDLDLALEGDGPLDNQIVMALDLAFEESLLPFCVDVVDLTSANEAFREIVLRTRVALFPGVPSDGWDYQAMRVAVKHVIGGGWGRDAPQDGAVPVRVIRGTDFKNIRDGSLSMIPRRYEKQQAVARRLLEPGDILVEISGGSRTSNQSTGRSMFFSRELNGLLDEPAIPASFCKRVRIEPTVADAYFVYWAFQNMYQSGRAEVYEQQSTGISNFQFEYFLDTELLPIPSIGEQRAIGRVLGVLDDRIQLNRRMNETLEAMARALFKSWFVDFDPVRAKMEGRDTGLPPEIADLFPDRFLGSERGEIPEEWDVTEVGDLASIRGGRHLSKNNLDPRGPVPVFGGAGVMGYTDQHNAEGYILSVGRVGAYCGRFFSYRGRAWINNNASLLIPREQVSALWLRFVLQDLDMDKIKRGAAQPFVANSDLASMSVLEPPRTIVDAFESMVASMDEQIRANGVAQRRLAYLRDVLLSKLVSGEVRLPASLIDCYDSPEVRSIVGPPPRA